MASSDVLRGNSIVRVAASRAAMCKDHIMEIGRPGEAGRSECRTEGKPTLRGLTGRGMSGNGMGWPRLSVQLAGRRAWKQLPDRLVKLINVGRPSVVIDSPLVNCRIAYQIGTK